MCSVQCTRARGAQSLGDRGLSNWGGQLEEGVALEPPQGSIGLQRVKDGIREVERSVWPHYEDCPEQGHPVPDQCRGLQLRALARLSQCRLVKAKRGCKGHPHRAAETLRDGKQDVSPKHWGMVTDQPLAAAALASTEDVPFEWALECPPHKACLSLTFRKGMRTPTGCGLL